MLFARNPVFSPGARSQLTQIAISSGSDPKPLLGLSEIFGDLPQSSRFVQAVSDRLGNLYEFGAKETLTKFLAANQ